MKEDPEKKDAYDDLPKKDKGLASALWIIQNLDLDLMLLFASKE